MRAELLRLIPALFVMASLGCSEVDGSSGVGGSKSDPPPGGDGAVSVYSYGPPKDSVTIAAGFHRHSGAREVCTSEAAGECTIRTCTNVETPGPAASTGRISATVEGRVVSIQPTGPGFYSPAANNTPALFHGGESIDIRVEAAGDVPAHGISLVAPAPVVLTTPDPAKPISVDRASDLALAWSNGGPGEILFVTGVQDADGIVTSLTCRFTASAGAAVIPASSLSKLPASGGPTPTFLWVMSRSEIDAGIWHTAFSALSEVLAPSGAPAALQLTLL